MIAKKEEKKVCTYEICLDTCAFFDTQITIYVNHGHSVKRWRYRLKESLSQTSFIQALQRQNDMFI